MRKEIKCTLCKMVVQYMLLHAGKTWALQRAYASGKLQVSLRNKIRGELILGWCNVALVLHAHGVGHKLLNWL